MKLVNIVSDPDLILKAAIESKMNNSVIGIHAKPLGPATYLTAVKEIVLQADLEPLIILAGYDITGYFLPVSVLRLSEITSVVPFVSPFENPFLKNYMKIEAMGTN